MGERTLSKISVQYNLRKALANRDFARAEAELAKVDAALAAEAVADEINAESGKYFQAQLKSFATNYLRDPGNSRAHRHLVSATWREAHRPAARVLMERGYRNDRPDAFEALERNDIMRRFFEENGLL